MLVVAVVKPVAIKLQRKPPCDYFGDWQVVVVTSRHRFVCKHSPTTQTRPTSGLSHNIHFFTNSLLFDKQQVAASNLKKKKKLKAKIASICRKIVFHAKSSQWPRSLGAAPTTPPLSMIKNTEMAKKYTQKYMKNQQKDTTSTYMCICGCKHDSKTNV